MNSSTLSILQDDGEPLYCDTAIGEKERDYLIPIYQIVCPLMLCLCAISFIGNLIILCTGFFVRKKHLNPTLMFSLSLAGADAVAAFAIGTGLFLNSILDIYWSIQLAYGRCIGVIVEVFRLSAMVTSALHFMVLAMNHWIGITQPLHYASRMTRRTALACIAVMWMLPCIVFFIYFSAVPGQGFQSELCTFVEFVHLFPFRMFVFTLFFVPLAVMSLVYLHVFLVMSLHGRKMNVIASADEKRRLQKNTKALVTTLIVLLTYLIGWLPAVINYVLVCNDCLVLISSLSLCVRLPVNLVINLLIIFKFLVDPIIYTARMPEVRSVIRHFIEYCGCKKRPNSKLFDFGDATQISGLNHSLRYSTYRTRRDSDASVVRCSPGRSSFNSVASGRKSSTLPGPYDKCQATAHSPLLEVSEDGSRDGRLRQK